MVGRADPRLWPTSPRVEDGVDYIVNEFDELGAAIPWELEATSHEEDFRSENIVDPQRHYNLWRWYYSWLEPRASTPYDGMMEAHDRLLILLPVNPNPGWTGGGCSPGDYFGIAGRAIRAWSNTPKARELHVVTDSWPLPPSPMTQGGSCPALTLSPTHGLLRRVRGQAHPITVYVHLFVRRGSRVTLECGPNWLGPEWRSRTKSGLPL